MTAWLHTMQRRRSRFFIRNLMHAKTQKETSTAQRSEVPQLLLISHSQNEKQPFLKGGPKKFTKTEFHMADKNLEAWSSNLIKKNEQNEAN